MATDPLHDTRPVEPTVRPSRLIKLGMGMVLAAGLLFGALIGALAGHFLLDNAFGWHRDVLVGALVGAALLTLVGFLVVKISAARVAATNRGRWRER